MDEMAAISSVINYFNDSTTLLIHTQGHIHAHMCV